ncbi:MAG: STAS domain-containing protein [Candidatus Marinimicrobia bacterium]|nr:STAS domain-containing protein [Candidatus Neomarinimicrobiota bacterium]
MENELHIQAKTIGKNELITLSGTVGSTSADNLDMQIQKAFRHKIFNIILDLDQVNLITSAGLRVMLKTVKECQNNSGKLKLLNVSKTLLEVFSIIGITFHVYDDIATALEN